MMLCESQAYGCYGEVTRNYDSLAYTLSDGDVNRTSGRLLTLTSSDSDSGYSHSESDHWAVETEDDVFTEREVVLSYDGCELSEVEYVTYEKQAVQPDTVYTSDKTFKQEVNEKDSEYHDEIPIDDDVKNININEINCTDSFLKWLDSEQDLGSPECYTESDDSINESDLLDPQLEYSQQSFSSSVDYMNNTNEGNETTSLPPIQTMIPSGSRIIPSFPVERSYQTSDAFNNLIRKSATSLHLHVDDTVEATAERGGYGHILYKDSHKLDDSYTSYYTSYPENQVVIQQSKGELLEKLIQRETACSQTAFQPQKDKCLLECRWEDCWAVFVGQAALVRHIEKTHVELRRSDEFACLWQDCPRRSRPFNARYKLLIHMRVHSGEKPNKCPFPGCLKAFSRLENLKIHQRSHTGERPYCCQFPSCAKAFSNSSDRAKHQRTHYDTKPYACQVAGCRKRYTDPSSLRKHIKNHAGAAVCKTKKLIACEPVVTLSNIERRQRERLNSYVSETTSDIQEEEYNYNEHIEEVSDPETVDYGTFETEEPLDSSSHLDLDRLGDEIDDRFFDDVHFDDSNFMTLTDDEMLQLFCK